MGDKDSYIIEDLISQSKQILDDIELPDVSDVSRRGTIDKESLERAQTEFFMGDIEGNSVKSDGFVKIRISEDKMRAYVDFFPPTDGMSPVSYTQVLSLLSDKNIESGLLNDEIQKACLECFTEMKILNDILVAEGKSPVTAIPEHYLIDPELIEKSEEEDKSKSRVDYKKRSPFVLVKKGQLLAKKIEGKEGIPGSTVTGDEIPFPKNIKNNLQPGKNTVEQDGKVYASCEGLYQSDEKSFYINQVLQIESGVDYSTGNIDFPGDILIKGETKDGFQVKAGGRIYYTGTFDATTVECEDDLIVTMGILGRKKGKIKTGGFIKAKFIENCFAESVKGVSLVSGVMNSHIYTNGILKAGEKGIMVGGTFYAQEGIEANQIGSAMGPRTELYCGTDYIVQNKLIWARDHSMEVALELNKVNTQVARFPNPDPRLFEVQKKLQDTLRKINEISNQLIFELHKNEEAEVKAFSAIYPGVYIEICHFSYVVERVMGPTRFYLDKKKGKIVAESLRK